MSARVRSSLQWRRARSFIVASALASACGSGHPVTPVTTTLPGAEDVETGGPLCQLDLRAMDVEIRNDPSSSPPFLVVHEAHVEGALSAELNFVGTVDAAAVTLHTIDGPNALRLRRDVSVSDVLTLLENEPVAIEARGGAFIMGPTAGVLETGEFVFEPRGPIGAPLDCDALGFGKTPEHASEDPKGELRALRVDGSVDVRAEPDGAPRLRLRPRVPDDHFAHFVEVRLLEVLPKHSRVRFEEGGFRVEGFVESEDVVDERVGRMDPRSTVQNRPRTTHGAQAAEDSCVLLEDTALHWAIGPSQFAEIGTLRARAHFRRGDEDGALTLIQLRGGGLTLVRGALAISRDASHRCPR